MIRHVSWRALPLALLLVWAPLPFGSVSPAASQALFLLTALVAAGALLLPAPEAAGTLQAPPWPRFVAASLAALLAIGALAFVQSIAWTAGVARTIAPALATYAEGGAALVDPGATLARAPLSLAPHSSRAAAFDWWLPLLAAIAALRLGASRRVRRLLLGALVAAAAIEIAIGVELWITRSNSLWGVTLAPFPGRLRGSFVNPNHLSLFLEIALVAIFAWLWWTVRRYWVSARRAEERLLRVGPAALAFLFVFAGIALTASRAGILAAIAALAVQGMLVGSRRGRTWVLATGLGAALVGIGFVLVVGVEGALGRLVSTPLGELGGGSRLQAALATLDLWRISPVTGVGLGAFRAAFPLVQPESLAGLWRHAHSDWVELLATAGVVGMGLLLFGLWSYVRRLRLVLADGESSEERAAGVAAAGALVVVGLHSFADFGLTMPANALTLAVVLGAAAAARTRAAAAKG
ncbi:MAG: O-antigen ligase family protein [Thermoanaerobaculia bacterium]